MRKKRNFKRMEKNILDIESMKKLEGSKNFLESLRLSYKINQSWVCRKLVFEAGF